MNKLQMIATQFAAPIGRFFLAAIFIQSGLEKIVSYAGTQAYMDSMGVTGELLFLVIAVEVLGGLAVLIGYQARLAAFALAAFSIMAGVLFHSDFSNSMQSIIFMKNMTIAGGFLMIVAHGAGAYSLDNRCLKSQSEEMKN